TRFLLGLFAIVILAEVAIPCAQNGIATTFRRFVGLPLPADATALVVEDPALGYRLNPKRSGINRLAVRGPEIAIPKPKGIFRLLFLGDSLLFDEPPGIVK